MQHERSARTVHTSQEAARTAASLAIIAGEASMVEVWNTTAAAVFFLDGDDPDADQTVWVCDVYTPYTSATMSYEVVGNVVHNLANVDAERGIPTDSEDAPEQNLPLPGAMALKVARQAKHLNDPFGFDDED